MHELSIAKSLFDDAQEIAFKRGIDRINLIRIKLGVASGIDADMLRHSLVDHIFPESIAEDAEVEFTIEPLIAKCTKCNEEITQIGIGGGCPKCFSKDLDIIGGIKVLVEEVK